MLENDPLLRAQLIEIYVFDKYVFTESNYSLFDDSFDISLQFQNTEIPKPQLQQFACVKASEIVFGKPLMNLQTSVALDHTIGLNSEFLDISLPPSYVPLL